VFDPQTGKRFRQITLAAHARVSTHSFNPVDSVFDSMACPSASRCVWLSATGSATAFDPLTGRRRAPKVVDHFNTGGQRVTSIACPSPRQCTVVDFKGREVTFNPA
jgi:hypothetical protein